MVKQNFLKPKIHIKDFKILTQEPDIEYKSILHEISADRKGDYGIPYESNSISIEYVGINFTNPNSVKYRYRLTGGSWSPITGKTSVSYSNLPPGSFKFEVICKDINGEWNYSTAEIKFKIVAPFWRTYWFYAGLSFLALLVIYALYRLRVSTITRKNKELEERIKFRLKYEKELERSERELLKAKEKAERSDMLKSEFLAQMSHEIRTPVNSILNFSNLLKNEMEDKISEDLREGFSIIESGGRRLIRTVDSILNMSQIQTNIFETFPAVIDLDQILYNLTREFKSSAVQKNLELLYINKDRRSKLYGDEYTITQLFANLIDNSIKYTQAGFVTIELSSDENDNIVVTVADSGVGMSEEFKKTLFEPFSQEETGYTRKFEGTGLGLALVNKYCELNNAQISYKSKKGEGTTFMVVFPKQ
jgi:signal transduction histidine kinase